MGFESERASIESRLDTLWDETADGPILWDNVGNRDQPDPENMHTLKGWIRPIILNSAGSQLTLGQTPTIRHDGVLSVDCFSPAEQGTSQARQLADKVSEIFNRASFDSIRCRIASLTNVGASGGWYQVTVTIPFIRDETT